MGHMMKNPSSRLGAVLEALLVTFLWSTSFVLIKIGLHDIPALTFAGLRYTLAFLLLLPFLFRRARSTELQNLSADKWIRLILLGLLYYPVTMGTQFLGLAYLPAVNVSMLLNFTPLIVALLGIRLLAERPTLLQWGGVWLFLIGTVAYFYPVSLLGGEAFGLTVVFVGVFANAGSSLLGRQINRPGDIDPLTVTAVSMGVGAVVLLAMGILTEGLPVLSLVNWAIIGWLALVNTAFAFTLWNRTLRVLSATESSIINGVMLVQIAVLAWVFLGEPLTRQEILGMAIAGLGILLVQLRPPETPPVLRRSPQP
ncbi:MAG: DMT family transporter [Candidatus Geothermarchaeales archaeon]